MYIKKVTVTKPIKGAITDTLNIDNKATNAPSIHLIEEMLQDMYEKIYPVGSIYMSVNSVNPSVLFGGTWERIEDVFLWSAKETDTLGAIEGSQTHTHDISHTHESGSYKAEINFQDSSIRYHCVSDTSCSGSHKITAASMAETEESKSMYGGTNVIGTSAEASKTSVTANHMPPYMNVAVWKRIS